MAIRVHRNTYFYLHRKKIHMSFTKTISIFSIISLLLFISCSDKKQYTAYQCPMKCESEKTYTQAGKCPVCGMDLDGIETKNK